MCCYTNLMTPSLYPPPTGPTGLPCSVSGSMSSVAGGTPTSVSGHPHLSHHHHLRSLSQRNSSVASSFVDTGSSPTASSAPFSSHLRELETFRRKSSTSGNASNNVDTPQSAPGGGVAGPVSSEGGGSEPTTAATPATGNRAGHHHYNQTQSSSQQYNRYHHHHHHQHPQQQQANGYQEAMLQHVDSNQQHLSSGSDYKPNAPHIQGTWNTRWVKKSSRVYLRRFRILNISSNAWGLAVGKDSRERLKMLCEPPVEFEFGFQLNLRCKLRVNDAYYKQIDHDY